MEFMHYNFNCVYILSLKSSGHYFSLANIHRKYLVRRAMGIREEPFWGNIPEFWREFLCFKGTLELHFRCRHSPRGDELHQRVHVQSDGVCSCVHNQRTESPLASPFHRAPSFCSSQLAMQWPDAHVYYSHWDCDWINDVSAARAECKLHADVKLITGKCNDRFARDSANLWDALISSRAAVTHGRSTWVANGGAMQKNKGIAIMENGETMSYNWHGKWCMWHMMSPRLCLPVRAHACILDNAYIRVYNIHNMRQVWLWHKENA